MSGIILRIRVQQSHVCGGVAPRGTGENCGPVKYEEALRVCGAATGLKQIRSPINAPIFPLPRAAGAGACAVTAVRRAQAVPAVCKIPEIYEFADRCHDGVGEEFYTTVCELVNALPPLFG